jgi:cell shape-determining protein MreC
MKQLKLKPIVFKLYRIPPEQQQRMDELADKCTEGTLSKREYQEYRQLVEEAQRLTIENAKTLVRFKNPELFDLGEYLNPPKRKKGRQSAISEE